MEHNAISFYSGHTYVIERVSRKNNAEKHYTVNVVSADKQYIYSQRYFDFGPGMGPNG